jgi:hypothetical protein
MNNWEYKIEILESQEWFTRRLNAVNPDIELLLKNLGNDGWELISAAPMAQGIEHGKTSHSVLIFKRPQK